MTITLLTNPPRPTPYTSPAQAIRHLALPTMKGKPFKLQLEHMGRIFVNEYSGTGDFIRSTTH